jgi:hypothetical protein
MIDYKVGDLVSFKWPGFNKPLRVGIVLKNSQETFNVKWFWYNKTFYLEEQFDDAAKLNKKYIIGIVEYTKKSDDICIEVLSNANYSYLYGS